jgi:hypothetical protein
MYFKRNTIFLFGIQDLIQILLNDLKAFYKYITICSLICHEVVDSLTNFFSLPDDLSRAMKFK